MILAHAFGERYDLPLPLWLFLIGGGIAVFASFLLVVPRPVPAGNEATASRPAPLARLNPWTATATMLIFTALLAAGLFGTQEQAENLLPSTFWVVGWIAVPLSCATIGDWTTRVNPMRIVAQLADSDRLRSALIGSPEKIAWPAWLAWWPAAGVYFVVACGELIFNQTATLPQVTAVGLIIAAIVSGAGGLVFGAPAWLKRGEMFSVLYSTWGRLGYLRFGAGGRSGFGGGLAIRFEPVSSRVLFVVLLLVSVSFDGLLSTPSWHRFQLRQAGSAGLLPLTTASFVALIVLTLAVFGGFAVAAARLGGHGTTDASRPGGATRPSRPTQPGGATPPGGDTRRRRSGAASKALAGLLPSLLPIAFGYLLAHNMQYLLINGQLFVPLLGDPAGQGWHLLPAPFNDEYAIHTNLLPSAFYWYTAALAIIAVHIVAVVLAHRHLGLAGASPQHSRRSEWPWLAAMIGYTMVSLWLLAQPLVQEAPVGEPAAQEPVAAGATGPVAGSATSSIRATGSVANTGADFDMAMTGSA